MNEHENHQARPSDHHPQQVPLSLLPALFARLHLDEPTRTRDTSLKALRKSLAGREWTERAAAVQELAKMSDPETFELLLSALHDEDGSVRAGVVCALGKRGDPQDQVVLEHLEAALYDPEWHVRESAVYALGMLGQAASISARSELVRDSDEAVRRAAIEVSRRFQGDALREAHGDVLSVPGPTVHYPDTPGATRSRWLPRSFSRLVPRSHPHSRESTMLEEKQAVTYEDGVDEDGVVKMIGKRVPGHPARARSWLKILEQAVAVLLMLGIVIGWLAVSRLPHSTTSMPGARSFGAPIITINGHVSSSQKWSADGRRFSYIYVDTHKHTLEVQTVDVVSKRSSSYPVLDSSWIASSSQHNDLQLLMDHYLLAIRPQGKNLATMEIWDITARRPVSVQTILAYMSSESPAPAHFLVASGDQQRVAGFSADGRVTIWDVASGRKLITCEGPVLSDVTGISPLIKWYDHDRRLLFFNGSNRLEAWTTATGARIFDRQDGSQMAFPPRISPDNKYIAWFTAADATRLEILDARSGKIVRTYHLTIPDGTDAIIQWQSDGAYLPVSYIHNKPPFLSRQMRIWNIFTGQTALTIPSTQSDDMFWLTDDGQYAVLVKPARRSMDIWRVSNGHHIATVPVPGIQVNPPAISIGGNRYIVAGEKSRFNIWDIATGKLLYTYHGFTPFAMYYGYGDVSWSPDGKYLLINTWKGSSPGDGVLFIWRIP